MRIGKPSLHNIKVSGKNTWEARTLCLKKNESGSDERAWASMRAHPTRQRSPIRKKMTEQMGPKIINGLLILKMGVRRRFIYFVLFLKNLMFSLRWFICL